jgi:hypothetical protein
MLAMTIISCVSQNKTTVIRDMEKKDSVQALKALIEKLNSIGMLEDIIDELPADGSGSDTEVAGGANKIFNTLLEDAETFPQPAKSVVYSILGQMYEVYYNQNARFNTRTYTAIEKADINTWDARSISEAAIKYYKMSLQEAEILQATPIDDYKDILIKGFDPAFQPTLYDVLANRAVSFFSSRYNTLALPQTAFVVNNPDYFADARKFAGMNIETSDTLSPLYLALKTYRDMLLFRLKDKNNMPALIETDLRRMDFLHTRGVYADGDKLYLNAITKMSETYEPYPHNAKVLLKLVEIYFKNGQSWRNDRNEANKSGYSKAMEICERARKYQQEDVLDYEAAIRKPELNLTFESVQLPGKPFLARLQFRNLKKAYMIILPLTEKEAHEYRFEVDGYKGNNYYSFKDFLGKVKGTPVEQSFDLPEQSDYQMYSAEVSMNPLAEGCYLIFASDSSVSEMGTLLSGNYDNRQFIQVSPLMLQYNVVGGVMTAVATDRASGEPLPKAKITVVDDKNREKSLVCNNDGVATSEGFDRYSYKYISVEHPKGRLFVFSPRAYNYNNSSRPDTSRMATILTDRSIYRPGQTVYYKAILYDRFGYGDYRIVSGKRVDIRLRDVNNQVVAEKTLITNDFGSVDGYFAIPQGLLNGRMSIECVGASSVGFRVEEYKRPTFDVVFEPLKGDFMLDKPVEVRAKATALAGYAIDEAEVRYRVVRRARYRYYYWWLPPIASDEREIASGTAKTDTQGFTDIRFDALADDLSDDQRIYTYTVTIDVTDSNGETRSASTDVNISRKPLLINTNLSDEVTLGKLDNYTVEATNLNGVSTTVALKVEITALESPSGILRKRLWNEYDIDFQLISENKFCRDFPNDSYDDELNPIKFKSLRQVAAYNLELDGKKNLDLSALREPGYYKVRLVADNRKGVVVEEIRYVLLTSGKPERITTIDKWFKAVKTEGEPGDTAEFWLAGAADKTFVYSELIHDNRIVEAKWIKTGATPVKVIYPIKEKYRGGFAVQFSMVQNNRKYSVTQSVVVPYTNKMLDVSLATFRDKLLPGENETWRMKITDKQSNNPVDKQQAELVASLYDASLDQFAPHSWRDFSSFYSQNVNVYAFVWKNAEIGNLLTVAKDSRTDVLSGQSTVLLADIDWRGMEYKNVMYPHGRGGQMVLRSAARNMDDVMVVGYAPMPSAVLEEKAVTANREVESYNVKAADNNADLSSVATRTNFNETAFFYPTLRTDANGEILIEFTIPEALTKWKLLSFAHTREFKIGSYVNELITRKQVAISANPPRFFRENDTVEFAAKVNNLTETSLEGRALLRFYDALTMNPVDALILSESTQTFNVQAGESAPLRWRLEIPAGLQAVVYKVTAQAGDHSDGEGKTVPVLTNSMLVTESLPFGIRAGKEKSLVLEKLSNNRSTTLRNHSLTLEFTSAPAWYAVQALPYIMEYPYECAEQTFSRFYANSLATNIVNSTPRIKQVFDLWNTLDSKTLLSNLEKNQELKQSVLEETPWLMDAQNETERKKRIALLFDLNRMSGELNRAFSKLSKIQHSDGGFPWFEDNPANRYVTQHIVVGLAHLLKLNALPKKYSGESAEIISKGLSFIDYETWKDYDRLLREKAGSGRDKNFLNERHIDPIHLHYLYACSFNAHIPSSDKHKAAFDYYLSQAATHWKSFSIYEKALAAIILNRYGSVTTALAIIAYLKETALQSEEFGMYWKENTAGYFWHQAVVETQALLIEAFDEVSKDSASVEEMKIWLLRNKQTNDWKTTKATSEAVYALLMTGGSLLDESRLLEVEIAGQTLDRVAKEAIKPEPGLGYVKTSWQGADIVPEMSRLKVRNPNSKGIAWGGLYWQYFEQLDKITTAATNLRMNKQLFLRTLTPQGEVLQAISDSKPLKVGDLVRVRLELRADRDYEYVHLKDMRAAAFEPVSTLSCARYQDGLYYYESVKDASVNFFIDRMSKGTYVFEYDLRVSCAGRFSNGITTFQCMYAPEFSAHSEGIRVKVE